MKKLLVITGIIALMLAGVYLYFRFSVKASSPESQEHYATEGVDITIKYNRPYKKGRVIFDSTGLVPFGKMWRTGANEATTFETNTDLKFSSGTLKQGTYSLWTIPDKDSWKIIFNSESGQWGINFNGQANQDPKNDVLTVEVPVAIQDKEFEQFTISIEKRGEEMEMIFLWDKTVVAVPFSK